MVKVHEVTIGNTLNCEKDFRTCLKQKLRSWTETTDWDCSDVILAYCPIVSRVGTDIEAALGKIPGRKPTVLVVLHHTFDQDYILPDTGRFVNRQDMITVNCLFHESQGLLRSRHLDRALADTLDFLRKYDPSHLSPRNQDEDSGAKGPVAQFNRFKGVKGFLFIGGAIGGAIGVFFVIRHLHRRGKFLALVNLSRGIFGIFQVKNLHGNKGNNEK